MKICGVDRLSYSLSSKGYKTSTWKNLNLGLRANALQFFGATEDELINSPQDELRELGMAQKTVNCLEGRGRALVHVGSFHGQSVQRFKNYSSEIWKPLSVLVSSSYPEKKILTLGNTLQPWPGSTPFHQIADKMDLGRKTVLYEYADISQFESVLTTSRPNFRTKQGK